MQHSGEELVYNCHRESVLVGGWGGQREGERAFQAILFNRIILPERTAEAEQRYLQVRPLLFCHTQTEIQTHTQINPKDGIDKPQCWREEGAFPHDLLRRKEIFSGQLDSRQNVTAANK